MAANIPREVDIEGAMMGAHLLSCPAEAFGNDPNVETAWALKAVEHMEVYFNLLCSVDPRLLRLTPHDDAIFKEFRETFPDFPVSVLCEDNIKSEENKEKWRPFCNKFANIVEDYNFGTLVRIDSSDEYSEKNTIFVPRIQFYAIEIARNREGCNDGIRTKFKPAPRTQEPITGATCCWITKIKTYIENAFNAVCGQYSLPPVDVKRFIRKQSGSVQKGDFSVVLVSPQMKQYLPYVNEIVHLVTKDTRCFVTGTKSHDHSIQFYLERPLIFHETLSEVFKMKELYGSGNCGQGQAVLIVAYNSSEFPKSSTAFLRNEVIAQHLALVMQYNGFQVFLAAGSTSRLKKEHISQVNIKEVYCSEFCNTDNLHQVLLKKAKDSKWRKDSCEMKDTEKAVLDKNMMNSEEIILDSREYLVERYKSSCCKSHFMKIQIIPVSSSGSAENFKRAVYLEHLISDHVNVTPKLIIHVGPDFKSHAMQSSGLLLEMLTEKQSVQQIFMAHVTGNTRSHSENEVDCIYRNIKHNMETFLAHKYGPEVLDEQTWKPCINILTETSFKFDLLVNPSSPPKFTYEEEDRNKVSDRKRGTFVQYNCARLYSLFKKHEELVNKGKYAKLPPIEEVDFSLLKLQEEWDLFFNYVLPFPTLIKNIAEDLQKSSTTHVCSMLVALSKDLSLYYNRTRVLLEAVPHFQKIMAARIWFLRAVHQVMKNALSLLNIEALEKM